MKKLLLIALVISGCSFKPSHSDLVSGGFKQSTLSYKGSEIELYTLYGRSWDLQYYPGENEWVLESGGYAAPVKINKKKFKAAIAKSKNK